MAELQVATAENPFFYLFFSDGCRVTGTRWREPGKLPLEFVIEEHGRKFMLGRPDSGAKSGSSECLYQKAAIAGVCIMHGSRCADGRIELGNGQPFATRANAQGTAVTVIDFTAFIGRLAT